MWFANPVCLMLTFILLYFMLFHFNFVFAGCCCCFLWVDWSGLNWYGGQSMRWLLVILFIKVDSLVFDKTAYFCQRKNKQKQFLKPSLLFIIMMIMEFGAFFKPLNWTDIVLISVRVVSISSQSNVGRAYTNGNGACQSYVIVVS